jgi:hypothetical protein
MRAAAVVISANTFAIVQDVKFVAFADADAFAGSGIGRLPVPANDRIRAVAGAGFWVQDGVARTILIRANASAGPIVVHERWILADIEITQRAVADAGIGIGGEVGRAVDIAQAGAAILRRRLPKGALDRYATLALLSQHRADARWSYELRNACAADGDTLQKAPSRGGASKRSHKCIEP